MATATKKNRKTPKRSTSAAAQPYDPVKDYAEQVVAGKIIAGPDVRAACRRHLKDLKNGHKRGLVWRLDKALHAIEFFPAVLKLKDGSPFELQLWQKFIIGSIFGWYGTDGFRRFRTAYLEIGKGNGKSPMAAGVGMYMMVADGEPHAEIYAAGKNKDQAMNAFRSAVAMRDQSPALKHRLLKSGGDTNCWQLSYLATSSFFKAISSETQSGPRIHCALVDEIHEHPNRDILDIIRSGVGKCQRSLTFEITNSGVDKTSICYEHHQRSQEVASGRQQDDSWFAYVCGLDEGEDPLTDEKCWIKANPNLEVSIFIKELRIAAAEARGMPAAASKIKRLNFCQWTDAESPWISGHVWMACEVEHLDALDLWRGKDCVGAVDLSGTTDLTALGLVFPGVHLPDDPVSAMGARVEFFTPKDSVIDRGNRDRVPYHQWVGEGHMTATPGMSVDYRVIIERLLHLVTIVNLKRLVIDPYRMHDFRRAMDEAGLSLELVPHPQGVNQSRETGLWMPRSIELAEEQIFNQTLAVEPNPCLRWNVSGAVIQTDPKGNRFFTKRKATGRIDGTLALVMAIGAALTVPPPKQSVYESRGMLAI